MPLAGGAFPGHVGGDRVAGDAGGRQDLAFGCRQEWYRPLRDGSSRQSAQFEQVGRQARAGCQVRLGHNHRLWGNHPGEQGEGQDEGQEGKPGDNEISLVASVLFINILRFRSLNLLNQQAQAVEILVDLRVVRLVHGQHERLDQVGFGLEHVGWCSRAWQSPCPPACGR